MAKKVLQKSGLLKAVEVTTTTLGDTQKALDSVYTNDASSKMLRSALEVQWTNKKI